MFTASVILSRHILACFDRYEACFLPACRCVRPLIGLGFQNHDWLSRLLSGVGGWVTKFEPRISSARSESGGLSWGGCDLRQIYFFGHWESEFSLYRRLKDLRVPLWEFKCEFESAGILPARPRTMEHVFRFECSLESENLIRVIS